METERYQLVAELQAKSRKLEEARAEADRIGAAADAAEVRAADAERERDRAVVTIEGLTSELDAMRETVRASSVDAGDAAERLAAAESRAENAERELADALAAAAAVPDAPPTTPGGSGTFDAGLPGAGGAVHEAVAAVRRTADAKIAAAEEAAATAAAALESERAARDGVEERLRSKIRTMDAAQDRLLAEIDAATGELERLDAELDAAEERAAAAEEREREALDSVASASMKSDRLMEMLTEQETWEREAAEVASAVARERGTGEGASASAPVTPAKGGEGKDGDDGAGARTVPASPAQTRVSAASAKLAADILQESDLGRAYHPLLASIEARLLHLQSEKLDVPLPDVPVS